MSGLNLNTGFMNTVGNQQFQSPISSPMGLYNQQLQQGLQPVVQRVPGSPGIFAVYNPMTGQSSYVLDHSFQQQQETSPSRQTKSVSPPPVIPAYHRHASDPSFGQTEVRSKTPPKSSPSPTQDVEPLPPPSANAFRRGHRKNMSSANIKDQWRLGQELCSTTWVSTNSADCYLRTWTWKSWRTPCKTAQGSTSFART